MPKQVFEKFVAKGSALTTSRLERVAREHATETQHAEPTEPGHTDK